MYYLTVDKKKCNKCGKCNMAIPGLQDYIMEHDLVVSSSNIIQKRGVMSEAVKVCGGALKFVIDGR